MRLIERMKNILREYPHALTLEKEIDAYYIHLNDDPSTWEAGARALCDLYTRLLGASNDVDMSCADVMLTALLLRDVTYTQDEEFTEMENDHYAMKAAFGPLLALPFCEGEGKWAKLDIGVGTLVAINYNDSSVLQVGGAVDLAEVKEIYRLTRRLPCFSRR